MFESPFFAPSMNIVVCSGTEQCIMCYYYNEIKVPSVEWIFEIWLISGTLSRSDINTFQGIHLDVVNRRFTPTSSLTSL